jgi:hypothetical protein
MNSLKNEPASNLRAIEIHNIIGHFLENGLVDFSFNIKKKRLEKIYDTKTDIIGWKLVKYPNKSLIKLSFIAKIRHNFVDSKIEKIYNKKYFTLHSIDNCFIGELGNIKQKEKFSYYKIHTQEELMVVLDEVLHFLKNTGDNFFNKYVTDYDFYKYYILENNMANYSYKNSSSKRKDMFYELVHK